MGIYSTFRRFGVLGLIVSALSACNGVFYQPLHEDLVDPSRHDLKPEVRRIPVEPGVELAAWWFHSTAQVKHKQIVVQLHGNAENMTSHFLYAVWLIQEGVDVLSFDYRGYGRSSNVAPTRAGLVADTCAVIRWLQQEPGLKDYKIILLGQSLGGAVAITSLAHCPSTRVRGLVVDSAFSSYRRIARQKLSSIWLTWPLQYPLSYLISDELSPIDDIAALKLPKLFFHSPDDPVVPYNLGKELFAAAVPPKLWIDVADPSHIGALANPDSSDRQSLLNFLGSL